MKINVNSQNNYKFYPDISDNLNLSEDKRFVVIVRKVNQTLSSGKWTHYGRTENEIDMEIDLRAKVKNQIVRIENPPLLKIDGKTEKELTVDILLSDDYSELFPIVSQLIEFLNKIEREGGFETKKS